MGTLVENVKNAREWKHTSEDIARRAEQETKNATEKVERAKRMGYNTLAANEKALAEQLNVLAHVQKVVTLAQEQVERAEMALATVRAARFEAREQAMREMVGDTGTSDLFLTFKRYSMDMARAQIEVKLAEMTEDGARKIKSYERNGETFSYIEERFGYHADVTGPSKSWRGAWEEGTVNWPSIGAQNVASAYDFIRVLEAATKLLAFLNAIAQEWEAQDDAD